MHIALSTSLAMLAFAANSILCRMALGTESIDAASFTAIRLISGALVLLLFILPRSTGSDPVRIKPVAALMLFIYAACFSFSYIHIDTGTGALILFGTVQVTMILLGIRQGVRPSARALLGMMTAFAGLVYLLMPGVSAPPLNSAMLMVLAGIAWGSYSYLGKRSKSPLRDTAWNFITTIPLAILLAWGFYDLSHITTRGVLLAIASGALASGVGYAIWYRALPGLQPVTAATVQLSVPAIAAVGGVVFMAESIAWRLIIATLVILGGIYYTIRK